jgi:hypothetical protein
MRLLDRFAIEHATGIRHVELYHGDLSRIPPDEAVDLLVVSAYPNDYGPTPRSLIGALHRNGLSVADLAKRKAVDLRHAFSCWLSEDLGPAAERHGFRRILCFEPLLRGAPEDVVGEFFQSLMPFAHGDPPIRTLAMPLVASGDQRVPTEAILPPLLEAAAHCLALGLPIDRLKIVERSEAKASELAERFAAFASDLPALPRQDHRQYAYDVFVSYSHQNHEAADYLVTELKRRKPDVRIFVDRHDIDVGHSWQQTIFESLDDCQTVVALYSPAYLQSKVCKEEFNIALFRHRESPTDVLLPIYLSSAELPTYMKLVQYRDCRESDHAKLTAACDDIIRHLEGPA